MIKKKWVTIVKRQEQKLSENIKSSVLINFKIFFSVE